MTSGRKPDVGGGNLRARMTKVGHVANRLTPEQLEKLHAWLKSLQFPDGPDGPKVSEAKIAAKTGVQQSFINSLLNGKHTTTGTARAMLSKAGASASTVFGTDGAKGPYGGRDKMKVRGEALDILSAMYEEDFLLTVQSLPPPTGSDRWTLQDWNEHVVQMRKLWVSGHLRPVPDTSRG